MMGPPESIEQFVGRLIPPACREEVLGDLSEKYTSPAQYIFLAARTIPFVFVSRLRRINGPAFLFIDPLLIYGAFLLEAWHSGALLHSDSAAFTSLALPAALSWIYLLTCDAFAPAPGKPASFERGGLIVMVVVMSTVGSNLWLFGFFSAWILVSFARLLVPFDPNPRRTQFINGRIHWAAAALFGASWVLLHFRGIPFYVGVAIFVAAIGYGLIKRFASGPGSRRDPL